MTEFSAFHESFAQQEANVAASMARAAHAFMDAESRITAGGQTLTFCRDAAIVLRETSSKAVNARQRYERGSQGAPLAWRLRAAGAVELRLLMLLDEYEQHCAEADARYADAIDGRGDTMGCMERAKAEGLETLPAVASATPPPFGERSIPHARLPNGRPMANSKRPVGR